MTPTLLWTLGAAAIAAVIALGLVKLLIGWLSKAAMLDIANERSSHSAPTPRGGGIGVVAAILIAGGAWAAFGAPEDWAGAIAIILMLTAALAGLKFIDDRHGLSAGLRLTAQAVAVSAGLILAGPDLDALSFGLAPPWLVVPIVALAWMWFLNLFNFMDGIDGIAGVEALSIGAALALAGLAFSAPGALAPLAGAIVGAALGFLVWNWPPARIFLGDVGSAPLGFLLAWIMLHAAAAGAWALALAPAALFIADATFTLARRAWRRAPIWRAHREHAYQRAAIGFGGHAPVTRAVLIMNIGLILAALAMEAFAPPSARALFAIIALILGGAAMTALARRANSG